LSCAAKYQATHFLQVTTTNNNQRKKTKDLNSHSESIFWTYTTTQQHHEKRGKKSITTIIPHTKIKLEMALSLLDLFSRAIVVFQLCLQQVQYISLFNQLDISWPDGFRSGYSDMEVLNINLRRYIGSVDLPVINYRGLFTVISIMIPIAITLLVLLIFQPFVVVILYTVLTFGSVVLIAGLLGNYLKTTGLEIAPEAAKSYVIAGAVMTGASLIFLVMYKGVFFKRGGSKAASSSPMSPPTMDSSFNSDAHAQAKFHFERKERHYLRFHRTRTLRHMMSSLFLILMGLILTGILNFGFDDVLSTTGVNIWVYVGYVFLCMGVINALYFLMCLFEVGRMMQRKLTHLINRNGLMLLLVSLGSMYIPVLTYALGMLMCKTYTCPVGKAFNPYGSRPSGSWSISESLFCDECTVLNTATCNTTATNLCPSFSSRRSWAYPETSCDDQAAAMFRFAAVVAIAAFGISIPAMFFLVTRYLTRHIGKVTYPGENQETNADNRWSIQITLVRPVASSLYDPYKQAASQFTIVSMFQRVLIMIALVVVAPFYVEYATPAMFAIFTLYCLILLYYKPYMHGMEKGLALGLGIANFLNGVVALVVWKEDIAAVTWLYPVYITFNIAIPVIAAGIGHRIHPNLRTAADVPLEDKTVAGNLQATQILDNKTGQVHLSRFFMTTGVFFVIAFGACVVGMLGTAANPWLISTNALYQTNEQVLAGYPNWDAMTANCCCIESTNPPSAWAVSERWICNNGKVIERGRQSFDGATSIPLRAVCGLVPTNSSCAISTSTSGVPYMNCPTDVKDYYVPSQVSDIAYEYYF
jgi:hypothetical protein